jgi:serine/threonine protein kinase
MPVLSNSFFLFKLKKRVILYVLFVGEMPFDGENDYVLAKHIKSGKFKEDNIIQQDPIHGPAIRELIKLMLQVNPAKRPR